MLDRKAREWLRRTLGANVGFDEPMARHTSFRIGGPADALVQPESEDQLQEIVKWTQQTQTPYLVIGGGTNLLVRDGGIRGLVIHLGRMAAKITWQVQAGNVRVFAGAGVPTRRICKTALQQGWLGMNFALGIPGTVGGAILMNAGTAKGAMSDIVEAITMMTAEGGKVRLSGKAMDAGYRSLRLPANVVGGPDGPGILLTCELILTPGDRDSVRADARQAMALRSRRQPSWLPSAGCFFKNPSKDRPAGRLIDEAGLKGLRIGDAQVSARHANFIVNLGGASAEEVQRLAAEVRERVKRNSGVLLTPEVRIVGEEKASA